MQLKLSLNSSCLHVSTSGVPRLQMGTIVLSSYGASGTQGFLNTKQTLYQVSHVPALLLIFLGSILCIPCLPQIHYVSRDDLQLLNFLHLSPKYWAHRHSPMPGQSLPFLVTEWLLSKMLPREREPANLLRSKCPWLIFFIDQYWPVAFLLKSSDHHAKVEYT